MSRFRLSTSAALILSISLWGTVSSAHGHGGGHGGGGHGGGHGFGYGGYHGFGYGGYHGFHSYGYGFRGFGYGGFGYPGFGFSGFGYGLYGFGGFGFSGLGFGGLGYGGLGYGGLGYGGLGFSGLGYGGLGYGGFGFRGFGYGGYGYGGYGYGGYGGFYPSCNCSCLNAYPAYGGPAGYGGYAPANGGGTLLPMPNSVSSRTRYVDYYARNSNSAKATVVSTSSARYVDYYARQHKPTAENKALLHVSVPADAELWLNGTRMQRTGPDRDFITPQLQPGQTYAYRVKARWKQEGLTREETVEVKVRANETTNVQVGASSVAQR